jgi:hypothetical protein
LIAVAVFIFVAFGMGSLYLSARQGFNYGSAEAFLQRQGTLVQERLTRELQSANSIQVLRCREVDPSSSPAMGANQSIIYTLYYAGRTTNQTEFWCIYQYKRASLPFATLWRCPLADASPDQTCTGGTANAEDLVPPVPASVAGQRVEVVNSTFCFYTGVAPCPAAPLAGLGAPPGSVDIRFDLDLHPETGTSSLLYAPRRFGFGVAFRN